MHVPQSEQSRIELAELASVQSQIISPAQHKPIISIVQDTLVGAYLFTRYDNYLTRSECLDILTDTPTFTGKLPPPEVAANTNTSNLPANFPTWKYPDRSIDLWSGRQILSMIIPPVNLKKKNTSASFDDTDNIQNLVNIEQGIIRSGVFDKTILGQSEQSLIHIIFNEFGAQRTQQFLDDIQNIVTNWVIKSGFSVGIADLIPDLASSQKMKDIINVKKRKVIEIIEHVHKGILENTSGKTIAEEFEAQITKTLNDTTVETGKVALKHLNSNNRMLNMVISGSKGSDINIGQMIACVGQQNIDNRRVPYGFTDRTLPHFHKYDDGASARGFVESSFMKGLNPTEFFFHAMSGREGLIDTAVKSVTGDTPIIFIEDDVCKYSNIGDWIDKKLDENKDDVNHFEERQMEHLYIKNKVYIPTTDENGKVSWGEVTAVTRHDPGTELYEIKTEGGKRVIVTESKSLLIWNDKLNQLVETSTPDIKIGDCVPSTMNLSGPSLIQQSIDMNIYFPKDKYIHGTDFNKACNLINSAMNEREKIPTGWWNKNNGTTFTLPYSKKSSVTRAMCRSNTENIKDGFIYPYHASREHGAIPSQFELNYNNGIFIGLFLSEGNADINNGIVQITNKERPVIDFVKKWFDTYGIANIEINKINKIGGTTAGVIGYSRLLAKFLTELVGHGARNKYVPDCAFVASNDFITGLLNGYYSGDGTISKNSIEVGSASYRLIEGISMLCNRLGIFGKMFKTQIKSNNLGTKDIAPTYRLAIRAQWAKIFAEKIKLLEENKNTKLGLLKCPEKHRNFTSYNDIILDKIVEINIIGIEKYPKVYDLTIPSTLNFGLANGLQVRDTSDTGYIQRKLIKGMEDARIMTDYTVRNANGTIIQFLYGEDGFDGAKIEKQKFISLGKSDQSIYDEHMLKLDKGFLETIYIESVVNEIIKNKDLLTGKFEKHINTIIKDRNYYYEHIFKDDMEDALYSPINFRRLIENASYQFGNKNGLSDLNPLYIFQKIENLQDNLKITEHYKGNELIMVFAHLYLSPTLLNKDKINKLAFDYIVATINQQFYSSIAHPGELVGTIAAQSMGEPSKICVLGTGRCHIGYLITYMEKHCKLGQVYNCLVIV